MYLKILKDLRTVLIDGNHGFILNCITLIPWNKPDKMYTPDSSDHAMSYRRKGSTDRNWFSNPTRKTRTGPKTSENLGPSRTRNNENLKPRTRPGLQNSGNPKSDQDQRTFSGLVPKYMVVGICRYAPSSNLGPNPWFDRRSRARPVDDLRVR